MPPSYPLPNGCVFEDGTVCFTNPDFLLGNKDHSRIPDGLGGMGGLLYHPAVTVPQDLAAIERKLANGSHFLTSPNEKYALHQPPNEFVEIFLRSNGMFGEHDPLLWPQRLTPHNLHLSCIPRSATGKYENHPTMFWFGDKRKPNTHFFQLTEVGRTLELELGLLGPTYAEPMLRSIVWLEKRVQQLIDDGFTTGKEHRATVMAGLVQSMQFCYHQATKVAATLATIQRWTVGVSRFWMYLSAWIDYTHDIRQRTQAPSTPLNIVGCFTVDIQLVQQCRRSGIPVYFIQPASSFHDQIVDQVVEVLGYWSIFLLGSLENDSETEWANVVVYRGIGGTPDHTAAIDRTYRIQGPPSHSEQPTSFTGSPSYQPMHVPNVFFVPVAVPFPVTSTAQQPSTSASSVSQRNSSVGPIRTNSPMRKSGQKKKKESKVTRMETGGEDGEIVTAVQKERDKRLDWVDEMAPEVLCGWDRANELLLNAHEDGLLDIHDPYPGDMRDEKDMIRSRYTYPDPGLLLGTSGWRRAMYATQWQFLSPFFFSFLSQNLPDLLCVATKGEDWRAVLTLPHRHSETWRPDSKVSRREKKEKEFSTAREILTKVMSVDAETTPPVPTLPTPPTDWLPDPSQVRCAVWELSELNFRCELLRLHYYFSPYPYIRERVPSHQEMVDHTAMLISQLAPIFFRDDNEQGSWFVKVDAGNARKGLADPDWLARRNFLQAFQGLMSGWNTPIPKPDGFHSLNLDAAPQQPTKWERALVQYYVQCWYDFSGRPAVLPKTLSSAAVAHLNDTDIL